MACTKSQLVSAINSFSAARVSQDTTLLNFAASLVTQLIDTLEFEPEEEGAEGESEVEGASLEPDDFEIEITED